jgi:hypothetical protein
LAQLFGLFSIRSAQGFSRCSSGSPLAVTICGATQLEFVDLDEAQLRTIFEGNVFAQLALTCAGYVTAYPRGALPTVSSPDLTSGLGRHGGGFFRGRCRS